VYRFAQWKRHFLIDELLRTAVRLLPIDVRLLPGDVRNHCFPVADVAHVGIPIPAIAPNKMPGQARQKRIGVNRSRLQCYTVTPPFPRIVCLAFVTTHYGVAIIRSPFNLKVWNFRCISIGTRGLLFPEWYGFKFLLWIPLFPTWLRQDEIAIKSDGIENVSVQCTIQINRTYLKNGCPQNIVVMPADFKRASRILDSRLKHSGVTRYFWDGF
jgi:hypothetical protein